VPLPPIPIITRWGTWLDAVVYYANNLCNKIFDKLDSEEVTIEKFHNILKDPFIETNLAYIQSN
jgi:hypothetical protein